VSSTIHHQIFRKTRPRPGPGKLLIDPSQGSSFRPIRRKYPLAVLPAQRVMSRSRTRSFMGTLRRRIRHTSEMFRIPVSRTITENATTALEVMRRRASNPKWLIYLPPTMSPCETSNCDLGLLSSKCQTGLRGSSGHVLSATRRAQSGRGKRAAVASVIQRPFRGLPEKTFRFSSFGTRARASGEKRTFLLAVLSARFQWVGPFVCND
jgi:hypothetical protein